MEDEGKLKTIILDNGSYSIKAGFNGEYEPKSVFPTVIGYDHSDKTSFCGHNAEAKKSVLKMNYPIKRVIVNNWDDMEKIWDYTFKNELNITPMDYNIVITQPLKNPKKSIRKRRLI